MNIKQFEPLRFSKPENYASIASKAFAKALDDNINPTQILEQELVFISNYIKIKLQIDFEENFCKEEELPSLQFGFKNQQDSQSALNLVHKAGYETKLYKQVEWPNEIGIKELRWSFVVMPTLTTNIILSMT